MATSKVKNNLSELDKELMEASRNVEEEASKRSKEMVSIIMELMASKVMDHSQDFVAGMASHQSSKYFTMMTADETVRVIEKKMCVFDFCEKNSSEQSVHLFDGTHWVLVEKQVCHDFFKKCAEQMGLPKHLLTDDKFMMAYYRRVLFNISGARVVRNNGCATKINLMNGTLVIGNDGTVEMKEHDADDMLMYVLPYAYDPNACCPQFLKYFEEVLPDVDVRSVIQEFAGYIFVPKLRLERMLALVGPGGNGKSVLMYILMALLGRNNVSNVMFSEMHDDQKRATMEYKLLNVSPESNSRYDAACIKTLCSNDPIMVKTVYHQPKQMTQYGRLIVSFNKLPEPENTWAFFRRMLIAKFDVIIPREKADKRLVEKICAAELPGILNWAIEGMKRLMENEEFSESPTMDAALEEYKLQADNVRLFAKSECRKDATARTKGSEVYSAYQSFCYDENYDRRHILGKKDFYERMRGIFEDKSMNEVVYFGLTLRYTE